MATDTAGPAPKPAHPATAGPKDTGSSPTGATQPGTSQGRRSRVALACQRCKRRKQRCDGVQPSCKGCRKADVHCVYQRVIHPRYPGGKSLYISALEERIAFLEARMPEYGQDHFGIGPGSTPSPAASDATASSKRRPARRRQSAAQCDDDDDTTLVDGVAYLSLCASGTTDTAPEPVYLGSSSGATIARVIAHASIFGSSKLSLPGAVPPETRDALKTIVASAPQAPVVEEGPTGKFPPRTQAQALFEVFFERLHTRWPILDRKLYYDLFERQYSQGAVPLPQRSILHLIYAIASRFLQLMKKDHHVDPQTHFAAAVEPMDCILERHNLATVQFLVLLAVYGQRSPYGAGAWSQVRYALTSCVELGLHRARTKHSPASSARELELRRRVFWACYCQERATSILLGRTFGIADRDIDVELPSASAEFWDLAAGPGSPRPDESDDGWSNMLSFIHMVKLRQLQSKIHRTVFRVDKAILSPSPQRAKLDRKITSLSAELDAWASGTPNPPPPPRDPKHTTTATMPRDSGEPAHQQHHHDSRDFFAMQYHKTVLSLYTPLLPTLPASDPRLAACARAASRACTAYKRLHQHRTLGYTAAALHACFVSGLALVYCLWRDRALFSYQALEAARACSLCLTVFAERWAGVGGPAAVGVAGYRDAFDALSAGVFRVIVSPARAAARSSAAEEPAAAAAADGDWAGGGEIGEERAAAVEKRAGGSGRRRRSLLRIAVQDRLPPASASAGVMSAAAGNGGSGFGAGEAEGAAMPLDGMVRGAVREAFMVVDEEAQGGWQGWRMFSEMVQPGDAFAAAQGLSDAVGDDAVTDWDAADDGQFGGNDYGDMSYEVTTTGF